MRDLADPAAGKLNFVVRAGGGVGRGYGRNAGGRRCKDEPSNRARRPGGRTARQAGGGHTSSGGRAGRPVSRPAGTYLLDLVFSAYYTPSVR